MSDLEVMCERPRLVLGTLMATAALVAGCSQQPSEPPVPMGVYKSVATCVADGYEKSDCKKAFDDAKAKVKELAPRYASKADCEEDYGREMCAGGWEAGKEPPADVQALAGSSGSGVTHSGGGGHSTFIYPYSYYHPYSSGFAYSSGSSGGYKSAQPVFSGIAAQPHLANGQPVNYGKTSVPAHTANPVSPAKFSAGQSVAKGGSPSGGAHADGGHGSFGKSGGFGSTGRGFSAGG